MSYTPATDRYECNGPSWFRRCGRSGLMLPAISLGMWHNWGAAPDGRSESDWHDNARRMCFAAFDLGITHFDLANNYGPPPGSAEERTGRILKEMPRDELIISSKAGYRMWPGPYGEWGSRKYLLASLDASLRRLDLDYVDIFYSHRPDPVKDGAPLEETMAALDQAVRSGKAIYAGISSYNGRRTAEALDTCARLGLTRPIIHQPSYSLLNRWIEGDLLPVTHRLGVGTIAFCPLAQGLLTDKYLGGIPADSRAGSKTGFLRPQHITDDKLDKVRRLNDLAKQRGQSLAQMALAWVLRDQPGGPVTTALIGASRPEQIAENVKALACPDFSADEIKQIDAVLA
jgi:L-glyceraldehyde 3-phosphate reductase